MGKKFSLLSYLKKEWHEFEEKKKNRIPKWWYYDLYENGYRPSTVEWIKRGCANGITFFVVVLYTILISIMGIRTYVFDVLRAISDSLNMNEIIWLFYGVVFGIAGSLIFASIGNPLKSVHTRFITSISYIFYYSLFFIILNIVCIIIVTFWL